ncbi:MAG: hypothetical protein A3F11_06860 [Gammaproteobacteria bacterium RIFCSPHIGHO2_12_FULL_37_14]|nr:MAG: hypothetical protein A3F11_06860 [Gammaproteobacteria bacterium RIFCSPHIGHO2_12_FULL_37_14]
MNGRRNDDVFQSKDFVFASEETQVFLQLLYNENTSKNLMSLKVLNIGNHIDPHDLVIKQFGIEVTSIDINDHAESLFQVLKKQQALSFDIMTIFSFDVDHAQYDAFYQQVSRFLKKNGKLIVGMSEEKRHADLTSKKGMIFTPEKSMAYFKGVHRFVFSHKKNKHIFVLSMPNHTNKTIKIAEHRKSFC